MSDFLDKVTENKTAQVGAGMAASGTGVTALVNAAGLAHASSFGAIIGKTLLVTTSVVNAPVAITGELILIGIGV